MQSDTELDPENPISCNILLPDNQVDARVRAKPVMQILTVWTKI